MQLYFAPLACSMATRIAFYEAGADADYVEVDTRAGRLRDGSDFRAVNPLGQVPVLRLDDGSLLTENTAILQFVARRHPDAKLLGPENELHEVQRWLGFVSTELHKQVFTPLLSATTGAEARASALEAAGPRLALLERHLAGRSHLTGAFTVADAYLATVLNWSASAGVDLATWPAVAAYHRRVLARPSVERAVAEERVLYREAKARRAA